MASGSQHATTARDGPRTGFSAMCRLASNIGLQGRELRGGLEVLKPQLPAVAFVWCTFTDPRGRHPTYSWNHYLAIFKSTPRGLLVADSHPWMPDVRTVSDASFVEMWSSGHLKKDRQWALTFGRG